MQEAQQRNPPTVVSPVPPAVIPAVPAVASNHSQEYSDEARFIAGFCFPERAESKADTP